MARGRVHYDRWTDGELLDKLAALRAGPATQSAGARIGRIRLELDRRIPERDAAPPPRGDDGWIAGGLFAQDVDPVTQKPNVDPVTRKTLRDPKGNRLLALLHRNFGKEGFRRIFLYQDTHRLQGPEIDRRVPRARKGQRAQQLAFIERSDFRVFARVLARRVLEARKPGDDGNWSASRVVAEDLRDRWRPLVRDVDEKTLPGLEQVARALTPGTSANTDFVNKLTRAVYDTTGPWLAARIKTGRRDEPLIQPRQPIPGLLDVIREAAKPNWRPSGDASPSLSGWRLSG